MKVPKLKLNILENKLKTKYSKSSRSVRPKLKNRDSSGESIIMQQSKEGKSVKVAPTVIRDELNLMLEIGNSAENKDQESIDFDH
tara:strand:- start:399 stop:653 length:255 start_codon:yes stop_codon:yes gene_type:complete